MSLDRDLVRDVGALVPAERTRVREQQLRIERARRGAATATATQAESDLRAAQARTTGIASPLTVRTRWVRETIIQDAGGTDQIVQHDLRLAMTDANASEIVFELALDAAIIEPEANLP